MQGLYSVLTSMTAGAQYFQHTLQKMLGLKPIIFSTQSQILSTPNTQERATVWKKQTHKRHIPLAA